MSGQNTTRRTAEIISAEFSVQVSEWQVRRLFEDGTLPEPPKFGGKRIIEASRLPEIVAAMRARGWLPQVEAAAV